MNATSPYGGRIMTLALDSTGDVLMGTHGGGVWKSTDDGDHWARAVEGLDNLFIRDLAVLGDGRIVAATARGAYVSADRAGHWNALSLPDSSFVTFAVSRGGAVFAFTRHGVLYRSMKGTPSWSVLARQPEIEYRNPYSVIVNSKGHVFIGSAPTGVLRSTDNGESWTTLRGELDSTTSLSMAVGPEDRLFASVWNRGVFTSTDNGESWAPLEALGSRVSSIQFAPDGTMFMNAALPYVLRRSEDGGRHWTDSNVKGLQNGRILFGRNGLYFTHGGSTMFRSSDGGRTWVQCASAFSETRSMTADGKGRVVVLDDNYLLHRTSDQGKTWQLVGAELDMVTSFAVGPKDVLFAGTFRSGFFASTDDGATWQRRIVGSIDTMTTSLAFDPDGNIYAGTFQRSHDLPRADGRGSQTVWEGGGLYKSTDGGSTWGVCGFPSTTISSLKNVRGDLYVTVGAFRSPNFFRSTDEGATWEDLSGGQTNIQAFAVLSRDTIYAGGYDGVLCTVDGGKSYRQLNDGLRSGFIEELVAVPGMGILARASELQYLAVGSSAWQSVGIPAGRPEHVFVSQGRLYCDLSFAYEWDDAGHDNGLYAAEISDVLATMVPEPPEAAFWEELTPPPLRGAARLEVDSTNNLYLADRDSILVSNDRGTTWRTIWCRDSVRGRSMVSSVEGFVIDPDSGHLVLALAEDILKSTDGGRSWTPINDPFPRGPQPEADRDYSYIREIGIVSHQTLLVGVSSFSEKGALYASRNLGKDWTLVSDTLPDIVLIAPRRDGVSFLGFAGYGLGRLDHNLSSFAFVNDSLWDARTLSWCGTCAGWQRTISTLEFTKRGVLYAGRSQSGTGFIYRSTDNGASWKQAAVLSNSIAALVATGERSLFAGTNLGVYFSTDAGKSWERRNGGLTSSTVSSMKRGGDGHLYLLTVDAHLYRSLRPAGQ
jgi:photosystem II stability/assembly factor-like uncharacterized protein